MIPTNEQGVVTLFAEYAAELGYIFKRMQAGCPDAIMEKDGREVRIEFEFNAANFKKHGHDPEAVDMIVCWNDDYPNSPVPVLSLQMYLTLYRGKAPKEPTWQRFVEWIHWFRIVWKVNRAKADAVCPICSAAMISSVTYGNLSRTNDPEARKWYRLGLLAHTCPKCGFVTASEVERLELDDGQ